MIEAMIGEHDDVAHYRVIVPAYAGTPISGMGAARRDGVGGVQAGQSMDTAGHDLHLLHQTTPRGGLQRRLRSRPVASRMGGFCDRLACRMVRQVERAADLVHGG